MKIDKRFEHTEQLVNSLRDVDIIKKQFFMTYQIAEDTEQLLNEIRNNPNYDGLILTPIAEPYLNFHTYKWKPVHELTIDFAAVGVYGELSNLMVGGGIGLLCPQESNRKKAARWLDGNGHRFHLRGSHHESDVDLPCAESI